MEMVAADASKKGLNIAYTIDEVLLRRAVLGDAIRIRQVGLVAHALTPLLSLWFGKLLRGALLISAHWDMIWSAGSQGSTLCQFSKLYKVMQSFGQISPVFLPWPAIPDHCGESWKSDLLMSLDWHAYERL